MEKAGERKPRLSNAGRKPADPVRRIRDAYIAHRLTQAAGCAAAQVERELYPAGTFPRREDLGGYDQPNSISRAMSGQRPLPAAVLMAARTRYEWVAHVEANIVWAVLAHDPKAELQSLADARMLPTDVQLRLHRQWSIPTTWKDRLYLDVASTRRVGRLSSLEALGILLYNGSLMPNRLALYAALADDFCSDVFRRLYEADTAFKCIAADIAALVKSKAPHLDLMTAVLNRLPMIRRRPHDLECVLRIFQGTEAPRMRS